MIAQTWRSFALATAIAAVMLVGCSPSNTSSTTNGGGLIDGHNGAQNQKLILVEGYVLAPQDKVPDNAIGYAVPIFTNRDDAARFCPIFLSQLTFQGALTAHTKLIVDSYGQTVDIAPFVWPVTSWSNTDKPDCATLSARYNVSAAKQFFDLAQQAIVAHGGRTADTLEKGPFIMTARRLNRTVMIYDLTEAPDGDYSGWLQTAVGELSNPLDIDETTEVEPSTRDKVRAFIFANEPTFDGILKILVPGYGQKQDSN
jgi:hypothetical protein